MTTPQPTDREREMVGKVLHLLNQRRGFDDWWSSIFHDDAREIQDELATLLAQNRSEAEDVLFRIIILQEMRFCGAITQQEGLELERLKQQYNKAIRNAITNQKDLK